MGQNAYPQSYPTRTMTVGQLIEQLQALDPAAPVIMQAPRYGFFGSDEAYTVEAAEAVHMPRREQVNAGGIGIDDETGEEYAYEPYTQVWDEWRGVVIR